MFKIFSLSKMCIPEDEKKDRRRDDTTPTKRKLRVEQWHRIKAIAAENRPYGRIFNYIPLFAGSNEAAKLLADTQEFKNATNIKVNIDNPQLPVRVAVLDANKNLYLQPPRESKAIFSHVKGDATMDEAAREKFLLALNRPSGEELCKYIQSTVVTYHLSKMFLFK